VITKKKKVSELVKSKTTPELMIATSVKLNKSGKKTAAKLVDEITISPARAAKMGKAYFQWDETVKAYSADEALALILDSSLTKNQYLNIRSGARERKANIYPPYYQVQERKKKCYPKAEDMQITELGCRIPLQILLDLTVRRIIEIPSVEISNITDGYPINYTLISKYGMDGASSQARYHQAFLDSNTASDADLFMASLVPLKLSCTSGLF